MFVHSFCYVVTELFDLLANVSEESVARPAPDHHDRIYGHFVEIHCHGAPGSNRVGTEVAFLDTKRIPSNGFRCCVDRADDIF